MMDRVGTLSRWTSENARIFCKEVFAREISRNGVSLPAALAIRNSPFMKSGHTRGRITGGKWEFLITFNLRPFRRMENVPVHMRYFYLYATIVQEIEHIRLLLELTKESETTDYMRFLAGCEQLIRTGRRKFNAVFSAVTDLRNYLQVKRCCYQISPHTLICVSAGFETALLEMGAALSGDERKQIENILDSLRFAYRNVEISYAKGGQPIQNFAAVFLRMNRIVSESPEIPDRFPQLRLLFTEKGERRQISELYEDDQKEFFNEILLRLFILLETDWNVIFGQNPSMRERLEALANGYCKKCIRYLKDLNSAKTYLREEVLEDNTAMVLKNIKRINFLMQRYGMENLEGSVIPLS